MRPAAALFFALPLFAQLPERAAGILAKNCGACHSSSAKLSQLDLSSRASILQGGTKGPAVVPGAAEKSLLMQAVRRQGKLAMPPTAALAPADIGTLADWINQGAHWPEKSKTDSVAAWWSFQPVRRPNVPAGEGSPIDRFLAVKLRENNLAAAPEASPAALLRRVTYDLTGLPPAASDIAAFLAGARADAYARAVDRLLASPRYGEKWARHWLDLVRYSDTAGFELDSYIADAFRYRDYVIQAFNEDKPYDRFVKEQIAGDEFFPEDVTANTATGFYCVGPHRDLFPDQADINRVETLTDYTDTVGSVFLGLTVGCARCHDHKFDPIPQKDYYRLQAVFAPLVKTKVALNRLSSLGWDVDENIREIRLREIGEEIGALQKRCRAKLYDDKMARLSAEVRAAIRASDNNKTPRQRELASEYAAAVRVSDDEVRACFTADEAAQMRRVEKSLAAMFANYRAKPFACGATDAGDFAPKTFVPARGLRAAEPVEPGFLSALGGGGIDERSFERKATGPIPLFPTTGRRHALGAWLTRPDHPLTARVFVNRVWQYHFGRGLVHTASDYGRRGASPSHPELLNWLAAEFVSQGWSVKKLHREILLSAAYRRAAGTTKESKDRDPENVYLARFTRRRLQAEELRDAILAVTGNLNLKMGGKPVVPPLGKEELFGLIGPPDKAWIVTYDRGEYTRRSIYMMQKRTFRMPMLEAFDAPEPMLTCPRRDASTTAPQSLTLLNGSFLREHAQALADQLAQTSNPVDEAWRKILGRAPAPEENRDAAALLSAQEKNLGSRPKAIAELVRALLNTNEFLYVD